MWIRTVSGLQWFPVEQTSQGLWFVKQSNAHKQ